MSIIRDIRKVYRKIRKARRLETKLEKQVHASSGYYKFEARYLLRLPIVGLYLTMWRFERVEKNSIKLKKLYREITDLTLSDGIYQP